MEQNKLKNMKKSDWQELAKSYEVPFTEKNEIRYLVEKIAEKIGVDDKIVNLNELKKSVIEAIWSKSNTVEISAVENEVSESNNQVQEHIEENQIDSELAHYRNEANRLGVQYGHEQGVNEIKQFLDLFCEKNPTVSYIPFKTISNESDDNLVVDESEEPKAKAISRLDELRNECVKYGVAWGSAHKESDLEQILSVVRGAVPMKDTFELNSSNIDTVISKAPVHEVQNPIVQSGNPNIMSDLSNTQQNASIGINDLYVYRDMFTQTIRSHFRLLFENEVHDMIKQDNYPFSYTLKKNQNQQNQIELFFTIGNDTVRVPSENPNDWLNING